MAGQEHNTNWNCCYIIICLALLKFSHCELKWLRMSVKMSLVYILSASVCGDLITVQCKNVGSSSESEITWLTTELIELLICHTVLWLYFAEMYGN